MTRGAWRFLFFVVVLGACRQQNSEPLRDPIREFPKTQQRATSRVGFGWRWPFTPGTGTLGCDAGAVVFRANGASYALNDQARSRGFASVDPIWQTQTSGPRHEPLKRLPQDQRMRIFAESVACGGHGAGDQSANGSPCEQRVRERFGLSDTELEQVEVEGQERLWPPLPPKRMNLEPLVNAGLALCGR